MKFNVPIEVSGLNTVVIDRKYVWRRIKNTTNSYGWVLNSPKVGHHKRDHIMKAYLATLVKNSRKVWVSGNVLNICR